MAEPSTVVKPEVEQKEFRPYIGADRTLPEFTPKAVLLGALFGILFGAATVYLALKAGLTVSASIPVAVIAISLGRKVFKTSILENNIIQTTGSAGESIAAGVVFTLPGFLFLSAGPGGSSVGAGYFSYVTLFTLSLVGGILGVLMMIPLRRSLIVKEHGQLVYPEGTACASVLIAGDKGGDFAKTAFQGVGFALGYALLQKVFHVIAETPAWVTKQTNKWLPNATVNGEITPEYLGVGYIIGPRIAGVLVAGGVLAWLGLIPLLSVLVPGEVIARQLVKVGASPEGFGFDAAAGTFANLPRAVYLAYIRQIGAGAVAAAGFITLLKTFPTIVSSLRDSIRSLGDKAGAASVSRTERDLSFVTVIVGSIALVVLLVALPQVPGDTVLNKLLTAVLIIAFGFIFVTVSSRIVGIIGSSSNPISGMTIATLMATAMVFVSVGWTGAAYEPMALVVGGMVCIAAANGGATSQDLKTGYLVGATPRAQQLALFVGAIASATVIGVTVKVLDTPTARMISEGITEHAIGSSYFPAPQATLMATLIKGLLSLNLDWHFVLVGAFIAITMELCGVKSLSFAVGLYLPLSTTLPIFVGGALKGVADFVSRRKGGAGEEGELGSGSLFATGLVAGGALFGVIVAFLQVFAEGTMKTLDLQESIVHAIGSTGYAVLGVVFFAALAAVLYRAARKPQPGLEA
ncbi:oligopeptide transporter, OPT family [Anaeromyxobacter dehalogenans 2CP-1]|uniref:Oligopeptide transporter, OPT family n=1 Tax=Anaeromyxobacter dehalogenans (strain ATCC BAA-258 / DSM 21875 / 2CP-1) TaxID=455488 RepID=B8J926_ANAD2|nr:oligopeptide transporter, OPT family [Anaeromyxobacter dehalogenans]ACL63624.1 oligopeptide transporter, OPT family [Anaeromyxobacter dehalogenans 2CP-1]